MLTREECLKIIKALDEGREAELRKFAEEELSRIYHRDAIHAMEHYSKYNYPNCGYYLLGNNQLLLVTKDSFFLLNSQDLYKIYLGSLCEPLKAVSEGTQDNYLGLINKDESLFSPVTSRDEEKNEKRTSVFRIKSANDTIGQCFEKSTIEFADTILFHDVDYGLINESGYLPALKAKSDKGKAYILGLHSSK